MLRRPSEPGLDERALLRAQRASPRADGARNAHIAPGRRTRRLPFRLRPYSRQAAQHGKGLHEFLRQATERSTSLFGVPPQVQVLESLEPDGTSNANVDWVPLPDEKRVVGAQGEWIGMVASTDADWDDWPSGTKGESDDSCLAGKDDAVHAAVARAFGEYQRVFALAQSPASPKKLRPVHSSCSPAVPLVHVDLQETQGIGERKKEDVEDVTEKEHDLLVGTGHQQRERDGDVHDAQVVHREDVVAVPANVLYPGHVYLEVPQDEIVD